MFADAEPETRTGDALAFYRLISLNVSAIELCFSCW